jgi:hypothetical protein
MSANSPINLDDDFVVQVKEETTNSLPAPNASAYNSIQLNLEAQQLLVTLEKLNAARAVEATAEADWKQALEKEARAVQFAASRSNLLQDARNLTEAAKKEYLAAANEAGSAKKLSNPEAEMQASGADVASVEVTAVAVMVAEGADVKAQASVEVTAVAVMVAEDALATEDDSADEEAKHTNDTFWEDVQYLIKNNDDDHAIALQRMYNALQGDEFKRTDKKREAVFKYCRKMVNGKDKWPAANPLALKAYEKCMDKISNLKPKGKFTTHTVKKHFKSAIAGIIKSQKK